MRFLPLAVTVAALVGCVAAGAEGIARLSTPTARASTAHAATASPSALPTGISSLVALGDSVPAGTGSDAVPFPQLLQRALAPSNPGLRMTNLGGDGATAADLAHDLQHDPATMAAVRTADLVVVTVGANDLIPTLNKYSSSGCDSACSTQAVSSAAASLTQALRLVASTDRRTGKRVLVTTYWNVFQDGDVARQDEDADTLAWSDALTKQANAAFCKAAATTGAVCVDLYPAFKGDGSLDPTSLLAADGDHPNQAGHNAITSALLQALRQG